MTATRSHITALSTVLALGLLTSAAYAQTVDDSVVEAQRAVLGEATQGKGYGPQSPRDLSTVNGSNAREFADAPPASAMNLCNIHFHESAEHKGGQFTTYAGNGDGKGAGTGFKYDGTLSAEELAPYDRKVGSGDYGDLVPGDTIEVHFVHTTAQAAPGETLGACLNEATQNPQLRVEGQVFVLVNDDEALDFTQLARHETVDGVERATGIPEDTGTPIVYAGSTTGPDYNEKGSPLKVTWSVRPNVAKVSISSVERWLADNPYGEDHAHGVRNLVVNPELLSPIGG